MLCISLPSGWFYVLLESNCIHHTSDYSFSNECLFMYVSIIISYYTALFTNNQSSRLLVIVKYCANAGIIADNFADEIILDPKEIAKRYMKSWFALDLVRLVQLFVCVLMCYYLVYLLHD